MDEPLGAMRLLLEVEPDTEPTRGTLPEPSGPVHPYVGWLGLMGALEAVRGGESGADGRRKARST